MYVNSLGGESPVAVRRHAEWGKEKANDAIELGHQGSILLGILWETEECASGMLTDGCYDGAFVQNISIPFGWWCLQAAVTPSPFQASQAPRLISNLGFRDSTRGKCTACAYSRTLSVCPELFGTIAGIRSGMIACENGTKTCTLIPGHLQKLSQHGFESVHRMGVSKTLHRSKVFEF